MDNETAKAINNVSKRLNEVDSKLDAFFNRRINETEATVTDGTWDPKTVYATDDYCMYNNSLYVCLWDCENVEPTNTTYWKQVNVATELNKLKSLIKGE